MSSMNNTISQFSKLPYLSHLERVFCVLMVKNSLALMVKITH